MFLSGWVNEQSIGITYAPTLRKVREGWGTQSFVVG
jgi:hypothetical protein